MELLVPPTPEESNNGGINTLLNEILGHILSFVGSRELIRLRRVNYLWNLITSSICRNRYVRVIYLSFPPTFDRYYSERVIGNIHEIDDRHAYDFPEFDLDNLPFSSFTLLDSECMTNRTQKFLAVYGPQLRKFELQERCYDDMVTLLQFTPNIHQLTIEENGTDAGMFKNIGNLPPHLHLLHLTYLDLSINRYCTFNRSSNLELLRFILVQCHAPVKTIKFSLMDTREEEITSVLNLIQNLESIHIRILMKDVTHFLKLFDQKALQIRGLGIVLEYSTFTGSLLEYFALVKRLLDKYSSILENLYLEYEVDLSQPNVPFDFPILPKLTQLRVNYFLAEDSHPPEILEIDYSRGFLAELNQQHVPILNQVELMGALFFVNGELEPPQSAFGPLNSFPSVKELKNNFAHHDYNELFPNLEKLTADFDDRRQEHIFTNILRNYRHMEHLCLHLDKSTFTYFTDINVILTGIPNPDAIYTKSRHEIDEERARHNLPSLLEFKRLKTLELRLDVDYTVPYGIRDSGVSLCLLELKPLEKLTIVGHLISSGWEAKLRRRHHHVVLRRDCD